MEFGNHHSFPFSIDLRVLLFQVFKKLTRFFKSIGVKAVFDTSCSRDLTLVEACNEFISRYKQNQLVDEESNKLGIPMIASACPGISLNYLKFWKLHQSYCFYEVLDST